MDLQKELQDKKDTQFKLIKFSMEWRSTTSQAFLEKFGFKSECGCSNVVKTRKKYWLSFDFFAIEILLNVKEKTFSSIFNVFSQEDISFKELSNQIEKFTKIKDAVNNFDYEFVSSFFFAHQEAQLNKTKIDKEIKILENKITVEKNKTVISNISKVFSVNPEYLKRSDKDLPQTEDQTLDFITISFEKNIVTLHNNSISMTLPGNRKLYHNVHAWKSISKKDATELIKQQIRFDGNAIKRIQDLPFYKKQGREENIIEYDFETFFTMIAPFSMKEKIKDF
jgi:hypothetical protein